MTTPQGGFPKPMKQSQQNIKQQLVLYISKNPNWLEAS